MIRFLNSFLGGMPVRSGLSLVLAAAILSGEAAAGEPVAIVEAVPAGSALQIMDYVEPGRVIDLGGNGRLVLGYLGSCQRETMVGGRVTVGTTQSAVTGGKVTRERVECDGGQLALGAEQAAKSGVFVMRKPPGGRGGAAPAPTFKIFSTAPVITLSADVKNLSLRRLDVPEAPIDLPVTARVIDLAKLGIALKPGATYVAEAGSRSAVFGVSAFATTEPGPVLGRLVRL